MWCATTSCSSLAIRLRSSSRVRRARSSAVRVSWARSSVRASRRPRRETPTTAATENITTAKTRLCEYSAPVPWASTTAVARSAASRVETVARGRTRKDSRNCTAVCAHSPLTVHGHTAPPSAGGKVLSATRANAARESHHAAIGRYRASSTAPDWAKARRLATHGVVP